MPKAIKVTDEAMDPAKRIEIKLQAAKMVFDYTKKEEIQPSLTLVKIDHVQQLVSEAFNVDNQGKSPKIENVESPEPMIEPKLTYSILSDIEKSEDKNDGEG